MKLRFEIALREAKVERALHEAKVCLHEAKV